MRTRLTAVTALALGAALTLAACGEEEPAGEGTGEETATGTAELPDVEGGFGEPPTLEFGPGQAPADLETEVLQEGDGAEVGADDFVVADYHGQVWDVDEPFDTSFRRDAPSGFSLNGVVPGWKQGLTGTHVGDRVLLSIPPDLGYGAEGTQDGSVPPDSTLVFVVDVVDRLDPDVTGEADAEPVEPAPDLPVTVEGDLGAPATISVDEGAQPPAEVSATTVATGSGAPVQPGRAALIQFAVTSWDNGQQQSTWESDGVTSVTIGQGSLFDQLADAPVGSRVVIQAPEQQGTGQTGPQPAIAMVVDVIDVIEPR
ncbi:FKBP-type peptidyl-prolyl cis-trans isomerase [Georgenia alba]|uniref:Peptidyl-prolyl cis-trans isomerase n=1 Tax=Georgenia alba TaxID=2233858 RepID=A0ABW2QC49_9MICO